MSQRIRVKCLDCENDVEIIADGLSGKVICKEIECSQCKAIYDIKDNYSKTRIIFNNKKSKLNRVPEEGK